MHLPTPEEFEKMKESLQFKTDELKKSEVTAQNLMSERAKIYDNLQVSISIATITHKSAHDMTRQRLVVAQQQLVCVCARRNSSSWRVR